MTSRRISVALVLALIVLRGVAATILPLSADEAYYWLWSKHLALGYFDHPPMIAWLIRAGTSVFGDTPIGVRIAGILLSLPASWFVWRAAAVLLRDEERAAHAALLFNLTLMVSVELLAATPDMPSIVTSASFIYFVVRAYTSGKGWFWIAAGVAAGLGLLAKFSMLFLGLGTLIWLILDPRARPWLKTPWPWASGILAVAIFVPNLIWQSQHHWETFAFQFDRIGNGEFTLRYVWEFLVAQFGLATPLIFVLMVLGTWQATSLSSNRLFLAVLVWVGFGYFLQHATHDRVQGNWPCFLFPALCILAADAFAAQGWRRKVSTAAAPLAAIIVTAAYAQALFGLLPLHKDPVARLLGKDFKPIGDVAAAMIKAHLANAILTTDYETTAWLRFDHPDITVIQINEGERYPEAAVPSAPLLRSRLVYLTELRRDQHHLVQQKFAYTGYPTQLQTPSSLYMLYPVGRPKSALIGKMP